MESQGITKRCTEIAAAGISPIHGRFDQTTVAGMEYGAEVRPSIHQPEYRCRRVASQNAVLELPMTGF